MEKLSIINLTDGKLMYRIYPDMQNLITIYEETFAEAAAKLNITLTPETGLEPENDLLETTTRGDRGDCMSEISLY